MNNLFKILLLVLLTFSAHAALPTFENFDQVHFRTNGVPANKKIQSRLSSSNFDQSGNTWTITNVSGATGGTLWTNDTSISGGGAYGRLTPVPGLNQRYLYPTNFYGYGWFGLEPQIEFLTPGTTAINTTDFSSWLLFSTDSDPANVSITLTDGNAFGQELKLMSMTNTPFNGQFTLAANSPLPGGGVVKLNFDQDWYGINGASLDLVWMNPDWWETGRWHAGTNASFFTTNVFNNVTITNLTVENNFTMKGNGTVIISNITYSLVPVWTNNAGVIEPLGGQLTNTFRFTSGLADNATNVAVIIDTEEAWTDGLLLSLRNNGVTNYSVSQNGGMTIGRGVGDYYGGIANDGSSLISVRRLDLGEPNQNAMIIATSADDSGGLVGAVDARARTNFANLTVSQSADSGFGYWDLNVKDAGNGELRFYDGSKYATHFNPSVADGASAVSYIIGTKGTLSTPGALIGAFRNNGTNKFTVPFDGTLGVISAIVTNNIGAKLTVGDTTFVDVSRASQTNSVTSALTFAHATNGVHGLDLTHVRWLFVPSGGPHTLTVPALWRTNVYSAVPPALTNGTIYRMVVACGGATATAAAQTNAYVSFEMYK